MSRPNGLYDKAVPAIMEMRATLAVWRASAKVSRCPSSPSSRRSGSSSSSSRTRPSTRHPDHGEEPETLGEALAEQVQRIGEAFDPSLTDERHEREMEMGDE
ncbi:hypothetical protein [Cereibacter sphaeroides]|uniref:hypothetical protein n=1 Tax=Cereibacter sphaeroides TaxID=1063 RepID=UPI001F32D61E|nr:hypothetical protein [Cereibacter sphaeroides]